MAKKISKKALIRWIGGAVAVLAIAVIGLRYWQGQKSALPEGIASGNGRLEAKLVDVAAKEPLRVQRVLVDEGTLVKPGEVLVDLDTETLKAQLAAAKAGVASAEERLAVANASITKHKSEIDLADVELKREEKLVHDGAGSQRDLDVRKTNVETTGATLAESKAMLRTARQQVDEAQANATTVQTRIDDATLRSPVVGRVLYRLAEPGEVLAPGGKALTLVDLGDVYMEIFLPSEQAARLSIGAEARITVDYEPDRAIPAYVSFVAPEAQFTPKQVETRSEREKLMFRVKLQLPRELVSEYADRIKTGVRGVGYVKVDPSAKWPKRLENLVRPRTASAVGP